MKRKKSVKSPGVEIDLNLEGHANEAFLLSVACALAYELEKDWPAIAAKMEGRPIRKMVAVIRKEFGEHVTIYSRTRKRQGKQ